MLHSLTNCTRNKLISISSPSLLKLVFPVIVCGLISVNNYSKDNKSSDKSKSDDDKSKKDDKLKSDDDKLPEPPTNCCMSGCANCVWVEYAEKLSKHFKDGGETARKKILETVTDENMRAFLLMELRNLEKKNKEKK